MILELELWMVSFGILGGLCKGFVFWHCWGDFWGLVKEGGRVLEVENKGFEILRCGEASCFTSKRAKCHFKICTFAG